MSGLGRIVTARGGMSAFEDKTGLETVIVRLDAIRAYVTQSSPRYPAFSSVRELEPVAINIPHQAGKSTWNTSNQSYTPSSYKYCEDALTLMNRIEDVLLLCRSAASDLSGPVGEPFHKLLTKSIEQMLARPEFLIDEGEKKSGDIYAAYDTRQSSTSKVPESQRHGLIKSSLALRLASLTFLDVAIREFFDSPPYPGFYTAQLTHQFLGSKAMANDTAWGRSLEMLIAVLMQADRMALERPWRAWYAADALTLTMRIGEWTWEAVGKSLRQWIEDGGLESAQPRIIEEEEAGSSPPIRKTSTTTTTNTSSVASSKNERSSDSRPRSKEFWNLKIVAGRFLEQWESSFERSNHPNPPLQRYDTEQNQQQQQQRQQQGYQAPSSQRQANQELPPPPRSTSQPTVQSQHISPMNVNESMTSVDGLPSGVSSSSTIPSPIGGEGEGAGVRNNQSSHNPPTW